jgi:beta-lactamase regulating signal transducer with metallopeptidase domain
MNAAAFYEWVLRSLLIGLGLECAWRALRGAPGHRVRRALPVAGVALLLVITVEIWIPVPRLEPPWPMFATRVSGALGGSINAPIARVLWLCGCVALLLREAIACWRLRAIRRASVPVADSRWHRLLRRCQREAKVAGRVKLSFTSAPFAPAACGLFRRCILLPAEARGWPANRLRFVMLHELTHFRRGDLWLDVLMRAMCALHWFNPFAWQLARRLALERELACDAVVGAHCSDKTKYAAMLLDFAAAQTPKVAPGPSLAMASRRARDLEARLRVLLGSGEAGKRSRQIAASLVFAVFIASMIAIAACSFAPPQSKPKSVTWSAEEIERRFAADPFPAGR